MHVVVVADDGDIEPQFELVRDGISNVTTRVQESKGLGEGGFANDIEGEIIDPLVQMDATSWGKLDKTVELLTEERDAAVNVGFSLENVTERVPHGDVPGPPNHLFVVGLGHGIHISRVREAEYLVPICLRDAVVRRCRLSRELQMPTLSI